MKRQKIINIRLTVDDFSDYEVAIYGDDSLDCEYEDDCFIHIVRNKQRIVFYNGQGKNGYTEKDIPKFIKLVENKLKLKKERINTDKMEKTFVIISHDRHRDDYVYIVKCEEKDIEKYVSRIWKKDFSWQCPIKDKESYTDSSGDYHVEVAILKELN